MEKARMINADDVAEMLDVSKSKAYHIIRALNDELKAKGYLVIAGRVSRDYFAEKFYGFSDKEEQES